MNVFVAGTETSAATVTWCSYASFGPCIGGYSVVCAKVNQEPHGAETFQETVLMRLGSSSHDVPMPCFLIIKHLLLESDSTTAVSWVILNHGNCGRCLWKLMAS
ncbi:hypothetical protein V6N13_117397 [Hibiscus sabdariffa]